MAATTHRWLKSFRTLHLYLGVFTAPALLFLAFTGALQSLDLHEPSRGSGYKPPAWLVGMSHMHKKQSFEVPTKRSLPGMAVANAQPATAAGSPRAVEKRPAPRTPWPMKIFFVLVSLSLMLSTVTGTYMGWRCTRHRRRYGATLAAGVAIPALLLLL